MLDSMPYACSFFDEDGTPVECNQRTVELFGSADKQDYLDNFFRYSPARQPDGQISAKKAKKLIKKALQKGNMEFRWEHLTADGRIMPVEVSLLRVKWQKGYRVVCYLRDLRSLHATQDDLSRMYHLVEDAPLFAVYMNADGEIEYANPAAASISGYSSTELKGRGWEMLLDESELHNLYEKHVPRLEKKQMVNFSIEIIRKDGVRRKLDGSLFTMALNGNKIAFGFTGTDVTEINEMRENLLNAQIREEKRGKVTMELLAQASELKDHVTGNHIQRTMRYVRVIVDDLLANPKDSHALTPRQGDDIINSSMLHDVGKIAIPDNILLKPGSLTDEEFAIMKTHTLKGEEMLRDASEKLPNDSLINTAREIAGSHHERWDGNGYPNGISGASIPLAGRIGAIADVFDALTTVRPYKKAFSAEEAFEIIFDGRGTQFDPYLIDVVKKYKAEFEAILLSGRDEAEVTAVDGGVPVDSAVGDSAVGDSVAADSAGADLSAGGSALVDLAEAALSAGDSAVESAVVANPFLKK
jgi:PAS domain S-box-containing protein